LKNKRPAQRRRSGFSWQASRRGLARIHDGGDQAVEGPGSRNAFQFVLDDPDDDRYREMVITALDQAMAAIGRQNA